MYKTTLQQLLRVIVTTHDDFFVNHNSYNLGFSLNHVIFL